MSGPITPDFPPQRFTGRYHIGFETDVEFLKWSPQVWEFLWRPVENYILCDAYSKASHEIEESGGSRFLRTEEAEFLDTPPLIVYYKPDEDTRRVVFFTVELDPFASML